MRTVLRRLSQLLPVALLALAPVADGAPPPRIDPYESSIRQLRKAVSPQRDGLHMVILSALRQLGDPTMRSLLEPLVESDDAGIAVHAVLGMAELDHPREVSPKLIARMKSPSARTVVIERAISIGLIHEDTIRALLQQNDLEPLARLWLLAKLITDHLSIDKAALVELTKSTDIDIAGFATWLLAENGDASAMAAWEARVAELPAKALRSHRHEAFAAMGQYRLKSLLPWATTVVSDSSIDPELAYDGLHAILLVDLPTGISLWRKHLGTSPTHGQSVRYAMLLLSAGAEVPAAEYDRLPDGEVLLDRLVSAGKAMSTGGDVAAALSAVIDLNNVLTARWALDAAAKLPPDDAARVYGHLVTSLDSATHGVGDRADLALEASTRLFELKPDVVADMLSKAADDSLTQEAILIGLLGSPSPRAGQLAATVKRLGGSRADSLALILMAKHADKLADDDLRQLGLIAAGGGKVSDPLQAQAAWLYLRLSGALDRAVKTLLAGA